MVKFGLRFPEDEGFTTVEMTVWDDRSKMDVTVSEIAEPEADRPSTAKDTQRTFVFDEETRTDPGLGARMVEQLSDQRREA